MKDKQIIAKQKELIKVLTNLTIDLDYPEILSEADDKRIKYRMEMADILHEELSALESEPDNDLAEMSFNDHFEKEKILSDFATNFGTKSINDDPEIAEASYKAVNAMYDDLKEAEKTILVDDGSVMGRIMKQSDYDAQFAKKKGAEERKTADIDFSYIANIIKTCHDDYDNPVSSIDWVIAASGKIFNYVKQFAAQSLPEISDDEIEGLARKTDPFVYDSFWDSFIDGAKAYREILKARMNNCGLLNK